MKTLSLARFLRRALVCLVTTALLLSPRSTPPTLAQSGPSQFACNVMDAYCDLAEYIPNWLTRLLGAPPKLDFQWNPVAPPPLKFDPKDTVVSAVNVPTWFWLTSGSLDEKFAMRTLVLVTWFVWWKPLVSACAWCFGDSHVGISTGYLPTIPPHWYEYSSYGQSERTDWGAPAFEVSAVTIWKIDWLAIVCTPTVPPVCDIHEGTVPFVPICKQKSTPVKQVESVLIRHPWQSVLLYP